MSGFIGGGNSSTPTRYTGLQIQTSAQGVPVALVWGKKRLGTNLFWFNDFESFPDGGKKGGKGGNGKGAGVFNYQCAVMMGIGEGVGPVSSGIGMSIGTVWADKQITSLSELGLTFFNGSDSQAVWSYLTSNHPDQAIAYAYTAYVASSAYQLGKSPNLPTHTFEVSRSGPWSYPFIPDARISDVVQDLLTNPQYAIGLQSGQFDFSTFFNYSQYIQAQNLWTSPSIETQEQLSSIVDRWAQLTNAWIFWSGDRFKAVVLGDATIPASVPTVKTINTSIPLDPGPYYIVLVFVTADGGVVFQDGTPLTLVGGSPGPGQYSFDALNYMWSFNAADTGKAVTVTGTFSSPFGYTPNNTVEFDLTYNYGLIVEKGKPPIEVDIADPADLVNHVRLEFKNRNNAYNADIAEWKDDGLIREFGVIDHPITEAHEYCDPIAAQTAAQLMGQRAAYIRNIYNFNVWWWLGSVLEPGDIVSLTDPHLGLDHFPVRIRTLDEDEQYNWAVVAEEFTGTTGDASGTTQNVVPSSNMPDMNVDPGIINPPAVFEPSSNLTGGIAQLWVAASGGADWGGCVVYVSFDGTNFANIGTISTSAAQGVLTTSLLSHADPDAVNSFGIDTTESQVALNNDATHADADAFRTLSMILPAYTAPAIPNNGECISYGAVSITGTYTDTISYLRRGLYGTAPRLASIGDFFTRVDMSKSVAPGNSVFVWNLPAQYIGSTIYLKFASFNRFANSLQALSACTLYQYTPTGSGYGGGANGVPTTPTGLTASPGYGSVTLSWSPNPSTDNVTKYNVYRAPGLSQPFSSASLIATTTGTSYTDNGLSASTGWTYFVKAVNAAGTSTATAGVNATVLAGGSGTLTSVGISSTGGTIAVTGSPLTGSGGTINVEVTSVPSVALPALRYSISTYFPGTQTMASQILLQWVAERPFTLLASGGTPTAQGRSKSAATGSTTFTISRTPAGSGTPATLGTAVWAASGTVATVTISSPTSFAAGDLMTITGPATADATLADISMTLPVTA